MENENKVIRGITTSKKLKEIMKEKGAEMVTIEGQDNVTAEQFNDLLDTIAGTNITMKATDKTVVEDVLNGDAPVPAEVCITVNVNGLDEGDTAMLIFDEIVLAEEFPAYITKPKGTVMDVTIESADGYKTVPQELVFDEDKEITVTLEKEVEEEYTLTVTVEGIEEGDTPTGTIGNEVISSFPAEIVRTAGTTETLTVSCDGYETETTEVTFDADKTTSVYLQKANRTVTIIIDGTEEGDAPTGTIGDEALTEFPAQVARVSGTTETLEVVCDGYQTATQEVTFDADKEITVTLEKNV